MTNNFVKFAFWLLCMLGVFFGFRVFAEEPPADAAPPVDSSAVTVTAPELAAKLDALQTTLDEIAAALALAEDEQPPIEQPPAPDYTNQLSSIETTLSKIQTAAEQATAETAQPLAFDKPFNEYTPTEGLLLCCLGALVLLLFAYIVRQWF